MDWSRKTTGVEDPLWEQAEQAASKIAGRHGYELYPGHGFAPVWIGNYQTDRVIAYHGFHGTWVGWDRGGPVIPLHYSQIVRFLNNKNFCPRR